MVERIFCRTSRRRCHVRNRSTTRYRAAADQSFIERTRWALFASVALSIFSLGCSKKDEAFEILQPPPHSATLERHWQIPDFSLTERSGRAVSLADLRGNVWVADFFYTTCHGPCP